MVVRGISEGRWRRGKTQTRGSVVSLYSLAAVLAWKFFCSNKQSNNSVNTLEPYNFVRYFCLSKT